MTTTTKTLYRAAKDDSVIGACSFAARKSDARAYLDNGAFGGPNLYRARVEIDPGKVLDLTGERDGLARVAEIVGFDGGAIGVDEWIMHGPVSEALIAAGYLWVRLIDSFPEGCETWTWLGASSLDADEPELESVS